MIDIGANLTDKTFRNDLSEVIQRAQDAGLERIVVTGTNVALSRRALELTSTYPNYLACTAGVHPHDADAVTKGWVDSIAEFAKQGAVAIGETGLDYFRNFSTRTNQRAVFEAQLELAANIKLPVFVHDRESNGEVLELLQRFGISDVVIHCFTGSVDLLDAYLAFGCYIGITGWICDERRGTELAKFADRIPDERLLIETDSPYLLPRNISPRPSTRRNEPMNLKYVRDKIAESRHQSPAHVDQITTMNAIRLFRLVEIEPENNE